MLKKNDEIKLHIEDMTNEGSSVGHYDGIAVFALGGVTGDYLTAHIIKVKKNYAVAIVKDIITPSPHRIDSDCSVSATCGGCSFRNMTYSAELDYKYNRVLNAVRRIGEIDAPVQQVISADKQDCYRNKAQYPVTIVNGTMTAGFYAYKSHRIIPCSNCRLLPQEFNFVVDAFSDWVKKSDITSYDYKTGKGTLRHIYVRKAFATNQIMVCAVINGRELPNQDYLMALLSKNKDIKSICVNTNCQNNYVILGNETKTIYGSDTITDELLGNKFVISPSSFYQVNHDQCEKLYSKAIEYAGLTGKETVVDLYCGTGTIGLSLSKSAGRVYGIEIVPQAIENAKINAKINDIKNAEFYCCDAFDGAKLLKEQSVQPDVVVLDPPRKGCQAELFDVIEDMSPERIVYVSCDPATLARDLKILKSKGYTTREITPVDMFPRTPHIESVCLLDKID